MAATSERRVGRLRLAASSEAQARRGRIVLEDALRTASLPEADGGRLFVVRRLALGKFRAAQSPAGVALIIEARLKHLRAQAVYALAPHAALAPAVYFRDAVEGTLALAARVARGEDVGAWFWPLAAPASVWSPSLPREEALRRLLYAAARAEGGVVAAASLLRELCVRGGAETMLAALGPADGPRLLSACEWRPPPRQAESPVPEVGEELEPTPLDARTRDLLARWASAWGPEDARSLWLGALLLVEEKPARLLDARLTARALRLVERLTTRERAGATTKAKGAAPRVQGEMLKVRSLDDSLAETLAAPAATRDEGKGRTQPPALEKDDVTAEPPVRGGDVGTDGRAEVELKGGPVPGDNARGWTDEGVARRSTDEGVAARRDAGGPCEARDPQGILDAETISSTPLDAWTPHDACAPVLSAGAGLFFLVPVMSRLGVAALLEANPHLVESNFPRSLLRHVCARVGVPEEDPVWRVLDEEDEAQTAPAHGATGAAALPLDEWTRSMRRWCRRHAGIGLRELVRRRGHLLWTRTHIDVIFDLGQADVRIRKGALDVDPGWVAWLGRVVLFHYREQGDGDW